MAIEGGTILTIIPARGGSKGLPGKNTKALGGKPLIAWTIEHATSCEYIDRIIVSTDNEEIAEISIEHGAEVPFMRPWELATDKASTIDAIRHVLRWLGESENFRPRYVLLLQPTSPLRSREDIDRARDILVARNARSVVSVCETNHHPWWSNTLPENRNMKAFLRPEILNKSRQELPVYYRLNGAIYLAESEYLLERNGFFGPKTFAYVMPNERSVDIDSLLDFQIASFLMANKKGS